MLFKSHNSNKWCFSLRENLNWPEKICSPGSKSKTKSNHKARSFSRLRMSQEQQTFTNLPVSGEQKLLWHRDRKQEREKGDLWFWSRIIHLTQLYMITVLKENLLGFFLVQGGFFWWSLSTAGMEKATDFRNPNFSK